MKNQPSKWFRLLFLVVVLSLTISCYTTFDQGYESEKNDEFQSYAINQATILDSLDRGNTDVFTLLKAAPPATPTPPSLSVAWTQADYFKIAQAFHENIWHEVLGAQNLYNVSFSMACSNIEQGGFGKAIFYSFKVIQTGKEKTRVEYSLGIYPSDNLVYTTKAEFSPNIKTLKPIDIESYRISAGGAVQIAEKNGGAEKRLEYGNACQIDVLAPGPDGKGWQVLYLNIHKLIESYFEIAINPQTGEFKVLTSKP